MRNRKGFIFFGFMLEIFSFVVAGIYLANIKYISFIVCMLFAMFFAVAVGKEIEKNAIEKYKRGEII